MTLSITGFEVINFNDKLYDNSLGPVVNDLHSTSKNVTKPKPLQ